MVELTFAKPAGPTTFTDFDSRIVKVLEAARKLNAVGWAVRPTLTGVAIEPPPQEVAWHDQIERSLKALGIEEGIGRNLSRSLADVLDAEKQLGERLWYIRKLAYLDDPAPDSRASPEGIVGMLRGMHEIEQTHDPATLTVANDYELGLLKGKLSAIRWVLGEEWEMLDT
jgi:hypothetical protein